MGRDAAATRLVNLRAAADAIATGTALRDRFNRPIVPRSTVLYRAPMDIAFQVFDLVPDLASPAPNMLKLTIRAEISFSVPRGAAIPDLVIVDYPPEALGVATPAPGEQDRVAGNGSGALDLGLADGPRASAAAPATPGLILTDADKAPTE